MAAVRNKKKAPAKKKQKRWVLPKLLLLLGTAGLLAFIFAIFIMRQELDRIGFFTNVKRPAFSLPTFSSDDGSTTRVPAPLSPPPGIESAPQERSQSPQQGADQSTQVSGSTQAGETILHEDRKRLQALTASPSPSRSAEELSHDDRKSLEDVLRSR